MLPLSTNVLILQNNRNNPRAIRRSCCHLRSLQSLELCSHFGLCLTRKGNKMEHSDVFTIQIEVLREWLYHGKFDVPALQQRSDRLGITFKISCGNALALWTSDLDCQVNFGNGTHYARSVSGNRRFSTQITAISFHRSSVMSMPVKLWAQPCRIATSFSDASFRRIWSIPLNSNKWSHQSTDRSTISCYYPTIPKFVDARSNSDQESRLLQAEGSWTRTAPPGGLLLFLLWSGWRQFDREQEYFHPRN